MKIMITEREATEAELAGSPHRQVSHVLVALPVGSSIVLTVPDADPITYRSVDDGHDAP